MTNPHRNFLRLVAASIVAALVLAACGSSDDDPADTADSAESADSPESVDEGTTESADSGESASSAEAGGSFTVGLPSFFVQQFFPGNSGASYVDYALFTPLTQVSAETGELENMVAESLESEDAQTWTVTLEEGWTFHDGSPVTAQSFADSWNLTADPSNAADNNGSFSIFEGYEAMNPLDGSEPTADTLSGVEVIDDVTLQITLTEPNSFLPFILSSTAFAPIPAGVEDVEAFDTNPIGNGPFMMQEGGFSPDDQDVALTRFDDYGGTPASADTVELRTYVDPASIYTDFQAGAIDLFLADGADLADASSNLPDQVVEVPFPAMVYLAFPIEDDAFGTPEVRQAISMAIDRDSIVTALVGGFGTPSTALAPATMVGGGGDFCTACAYDPEAAASMLESAGGLQGPLTLYTYQDPTNEQILEAIVNQLRTNLGVEDITFEAQEIGQLYDSLFAGNIDGPTLLYAGAVYPHLYALAEATLLPDGNLNVTGYDSAEFVEEMAAAASSESSQAAVELTQGAVDIALADMPVAPILAPAGGLVFAEGLSGVIPEPLGGPKLAAVVVN